MLSFDPQEIDRRIQTPLSLWEVFAFLMGLALVGTFAWIAPGTLHYDLSNYLKTAHGDFSFYYYAYWLVPLFSALGQLPVLPVYLVWGLASITAVWFAARVFGGNTVFVLLSYQMFFALYQGQLVALVAGALALLWWGMAHRRWELAGLGMILAATKFQTGMILGAIFWLMFPLRWRDRLKLLMVPIVVALASFVWYPGWLFTTIATIQNNPPDTSGNLALWRWIGPAALLLWLPPLLLPLTREKRILALAATATLAVPYFQQVDLLALMVLPIGWVALLGNLGYLIVLLDNAALQLLAILPLVVYGRILFPAVLERLRSARES